MSGRTRKLNTRLFNEEYDTNTPRHLRPEQREDQLADIAREIRTIERVIQDTEGAASPQVRDYKTDRSRRVPVYATEGVRGRQLQLPRPNLSSLKDRLSKSAELRPTIKDLRKKSNLEDIARNAAQGLWDDSSDEDEMPLVVSKGKITKGKLKSGMDKKATESVRKQVFWPHLLLQSSYITADLGYKDLTFELFVAGEMEIILNSSISTEEQLARLQFLKTLSYEANSYPFRAILDWYAAYMRVIELGNSNWSTDFYSVGHPILAQYQPKVKKAFSFQSQIQSSGVHRNAGTWFCAPFNRSTCSKSAPHSATVRGQQVTVEHICANCWVKDKSKKFHSEKSNDCPHSRVA